MQLQNYEAMKIAMIDNYDSFTYNLVHMVRELNVQVSVLRNDSFDLKDLADYDAIMLSPGPGIPSEAGLLKDVISFYGPSKPILGICLGEQAIGEVYGASLTNLDSVYHGVQSRCDILVRDCIFDNLPDNIEVGRYHSWVVDRDSLPPCLECTAVSADREIMALRHRQYNVRGIQFHPESVLTPAGKTIIENWIKHITV